MYWYYWCYLHPVTRAIEVSHAACKAQFIFRKKMVNLTAEVYFLIFSNDRDRYQATTAPLRGRLTPAATVAQKRIQ